MQIRTQAIPALVVLAIGLVAGSVTVFAGDKVVSKPSNEETYFSVSSQKKLPYLFIDPDQTPNAILVYMHGAGGGMEQGMSDQLYKGNFKKLKSLLRSQLHFVYVTPSTSDFGESGGDDLNQLAKSLRNRYGKIPIYLSGASAGGLTVYYALQNPETIFAGVVFLCPAIDESLIPAMKKPRKELRFWVVHGNQDPIIPVETVNKLVAALQASGNPVEYRRVEGGHNAPVENVHWEQAIEFLLGKAPPRGQIFQFYRFEECHIVADHSHGTADELRRIWLRSDSSSRTEFLTGYARTSNLIFPNRFVSSA